MERHTFLAALHNLLEPRGYLEVGVQTGASLRLASCPAVGVDPYPIVRYPLPDTTRVVEATSDEFFAAGDEAPVPQPLDLAFIDGMHLWEFALRDFRNIERFANERTVVAFDDVLPRNQVEGSRTPNPGNWAGDVWRIADVIAGLSPGVRFCLVDTQPTGVLLVWGLWPDREWTVPDLGGEMPVPDDVLNRTFAVAPDVALEQFAEVAA